MVAANDFAPRFCKHHVNTEMALRKASETTVHYVKGVFFFTCNEEISSDDHRTCGYNIYPNYPQQRYIIERE